MNWLTASEIDADEEVQEWLSTVWSGWIDIDPGALAGVLEAARDQCDAWYHFEPGAVPVRARHAQALQAKALVRSGAAGTDDTVGGFGETVTVFPMDWTVKRLLRPERRIGGIA